MRDHDLVARDHDLVEHATSVQERDVGGAVARRAKRLPDDAADDARDCPHDCRHALLAHIVRRSENCAQNWPKRLQNIPQHRRMLDSKPQ
eukprot:1565196-Prymnesium_polylepis.1